MCLQLDALNIDIASPNYVQYCLMMIAKPNSIDEIVSSRSYFFSFHHCKSVKYPLSTGRPDVVFNSDASTGGCARGGQSVVPTVGV